jgi:hypothetical protein
LVVPAKVKKPAKLGAVEGIAGDADARVEFEVGVVVLEEVGVAAAGGAGERAGVVVLEMVDDTSAGVTDDSVLQVCQYVSLGGTTALCLPC